jgi:hypothetical protein
MSFHPKRHSFSPRPVTKLLAKIPNERYIPRNTLLTIFTVRESQPLIRFR